MSRVRPGSVAKASRRRLALERLEKHIGSHKVCHGVATLIDEEIIERFNSHDKSQKKELERLRVLVN